MTGDPSSSKSAATDAVPGTGKRPLSPTAERALAEAAARRTARERNGADPSNEVGGRGGLEPTRYGDWEVNGLISDF